MKWFDKTVSQRQDDVLRLLKKYPDKIPIYITGENIALNKFLVPYDITQAQLMFTLREKIALSSTESIFLFFGKRREMMPSSMMIKEIYDKLKEEDDMLYAIYSKENTFG